MINLQFDAAIGCRIERSRSPIRNCLLLGLVVLVIGLTGWRSPLNAQGGSVDQAEWKRAYNGFAVLCRSLNLRITTDLRSWESTAPNRSMLIVLGSTLDLPVEVVDYVDRGGAALIASDQQDEASFSPWGVTLVRGPQRAARDADRFRSRSDCPIVTNLDSDHPVTKECDFLVANRPGFLSLSWDLESPRRGRTPTIGRLPSIVVSRRRRVNGLPFVAALEPNRGSRVLFVADQSIFSNQMLTCGDNARFALRAMQWLADGKRDTVLIVSAREVIDPMNPNQLHVVLPPPDPAEVIAALEQLPPEALIAFGDSVVAAVEDEGVLNEMISYVAHELPGRLYARMLILLATVLTLAFLIFRLFHRRSESDGKWSSGRSKRVRSMLERRQAAKLLLARFRASVSGDVFTPWNAVVEAVRIRSDRASTKHLRRQISVAVRRAQGGPRKYWTRRRLRRLQQQVGHWRQLHTHGVLEYHSRLGPQ